MLPELWAAYHNNDEIRLQSSSGGVFSALAAAVLEGDGVVFGSAMVEDASGLHAKHICCERKEELNRLRGSKYAVSDAGEAFLSVKQELQRGRGVLFCGTPCQVAALYAFLGKRYDRLMTVDFICHGVPAPLVLRKFLAEKERQYQKKVRHLEFRDKTEGWTRYSVKAVLEDGTIDRKTVRKSWYIRMFLSEMFLRPSCYRCRFKGSGHCADITLGDFWGAENYLEVSEEALEKGISAVVLQTEAGRRLFLDASGEMTTRKSDMSYFVRSNLPYSESALASPDMGFFRYMLKKWDSEKILSCYDQTNGIREFVKRVIRKGKNLFHTGSQPKTRKDTLPMERHCCGCMNCMAVCPVNAVGRAEDPLGFVYPAVDSAKCISCGRCVAACPLCKSDS